MTESEEELKSLLMKVEVESKKVGLKLNIQKMKIMASSHIPSWKIDGPVPATRFSGCKTGAPSQADVDRPGPREVLVNKEACLQLCR